jgi:DHA2 family metal-tetracycline-proton antiporter-like MFS transporter
MANKASLSGRDRTLLAVVCIGMFMGTLDVSIVNIAIPTISEKWDITTATAMWVIFAYGLAYGCLLPTFGKVGERVGFKQLYTLGFIIFALGSFLSGISPGINMLVLSRFIQGAGSAMMGALSLATITRYVPKEAQGRGMGLVATSASLGAAIGPVVGGFITEYLNFHWIFLLNVPIGILGAFLSSRAVPGERASSGAKFDRLGSVLIFLTLFCAIYGLNLGQEKGWGSPDIVISLCASVLFFFLFLRNERKVPDPLLPTKLIKKPQVIRPLAATMLVMGAFSGAFVLLPYYLEGVIGLQTDVAGGVLLAASLTMLVSGLWSGNATDRRSPRWLGVMGTAIALAAYIIFCTFGVNTGMGIVIVALIFLGMGTSITFPPNSRQILSRFPHEIQGEGSSAIMTLRVVGQTMGIAAMVTVFQSMYYPGHMGAGDLAAGFTGGMLVAVAMMAASLALIFFTKDPEPGASPAVVLG